MEDSFFILYRVDKYEEMVTETVNIKFAENLRYTINPQFLERLDYCGKINAVEKIILKDMIEDIDGNPRAGDTLELIKRN